MSVTCRYESLVCQYTYLTSSSDVITCTVPRCTVPGTKLRLLYLALLNVSHNDPLAAVMCLSESFLWFCRKLLTSSVYIRSLRRCERLPLGGGLFLPIGVPPAASIFLLVAFACCHPLLVALLPPPSDRWPYCGLHFPIAGPSAPLWDQYLPWYKPSRGDVGEAAAEIVLELDVAVDETEAEEIPAPGVTGQVQVPTLISSSTAFCNPI
jgi:hypothetical protein